MSNESGVTTNAPATPRKRGRPAGSASKNKTKTAAPKKPVAVATTAGIQVLPIESAATPPFTTGRQMQPFTGEAPCPPFRLAAPEQTVISTWRNIAVQAEQTIEAETAMRDRAAAAILAAVQMVAIRENLPKLPAGWQWDVSPDSLWIFPVLVGRVVPGYVSTQYAALIGAGGMGFLGTAAAGTRSHHKQQTTTAAVSNQPAAISS